ncbi:glycoside hydrolase family 26 protein [Arthrobacter sp. ISL-5]|uniref:glycoside hydrolase family 26 protein n=1 Tax=Arthrobacter sp. ISL-5 TaxID=2819111 RepID=UPI001BED26FC|nr:glycosyl hydrolase [Arthrobacter sp. ISL-5]MBT2552714.1 hypothetical protein [Arthrobacter sp. ISL-5]
MNREGTARKVVVCMVALAVAAASLAFAFTERRVPFPVPDDGKAYYGVQLDWQQDSVEDYASRLGASPAMYGRYVSFPLTPEEEKAVGEEVAELAAAHSAMMLTLEPRNGLASVTPEVLAAFSRELTTWTRKGVPVMVRFAHEMNGSWYPWGQQPALFIEKFRQVAAAVHAVPGSTMLWSPNEGGGYPFPGGAQEAKPGTAAFSALDTNGDGKLSMDDDPYSPYWPGDDAVDWVGLTLYHFGDVYPWGENEIPAPGKLAAKITGTYKIGLVDETAVPDFYATYAEGHAKPFAISETAAFYNTARTDGAAALDIKSAWWKQMFDPGLSTRFPLMKLAMWFEYTKEETVPTNQVIDWRATADPATLAPFRAAVPPRFIMAPLGG